ncbi:MAG TPA: right-handed parallel beta-helix repeat-containing protein [Pirellulaceae bacterium]|nr:right-handed parallel beta-helix repeat-containing protein [Pirellulaceae bacterium]
MRTFLTLLGLGIAFLGLTSSAARGQMAGDPFQGYAQGGQPQAMSAFQTRLPSIWPGNLWFETNLADNGLGYSGSYATLGSKARLFEDFLDGRWMLETQGHVSLERGKFFSNIGLERAFTLDAAGSDLYFSAWYDYDDDQVGPFGHTFHQLGLSGGVRSRKYDLYGNAYLPSGTTEYTQGDPTGQTVFFNRNIVTQAGIDAALQGFDAHIVARPEALGFVNGYVDIGTYAYQSDLIDTFAGISAKFGMQTLGGLVTSIQLNHDERFQTTGVLQVGWMFGARGARTEYSAVGRDLDPTPRNDHIVRYQQDLRLAIDPDTNNPYVVLHVDNTAAAGGDGTFQRPFRTLAEAQAASGTDAIIYVHRGDGTTTGMANGIVLKDNQFLLGDGLVHTIPIVGGNFDIFNRRDGLRPTITNTAGNAVTLANNNTVRGVIIDGTAGGLANGISGDGGLGSLSNGIIEDVTILGNPILNGINLVAIDGNWSFARNNITTAGQDGIHIDNLTGSTSRLTFTNNVVSNNLRDGIHVEDFDGARFVFSNNTTNGNVRDGIRMQNFTGTNGVFTFANQTASNNVGFGVNLFDVDGTVRFTSPTMDNNAGGGIGLNDVTGTTLITGATLTNNGTGIFNDLSAGTQELTITNSTINTNNLGIFTQSSGVGAFLTTEIVDNLSINNNQTDAVRAISRLGGTQDFLLENTNGPLVMTGNASLTGVGVTLFAEDGGATTSVLRSVIRNVQMVNTGNGAGTSGILVSGNGNSQSRFVLENSSLTGAVGGDAIGIQFDTNNVLLNSVRINNVDLAGIGDDAISATINGSGLLDLFINDVQATGNQTTGGTGLQFVAGDTSITRLQVFNSEFSSFNFDGIQVAATDASRVLANLTGNTADDNGRSEPDPDTLPFEHGFNISSSGTSNLTISLLNNNAHGNFERGLSMTTAGTGHITADLQFNSLTNNDLGEDAANDPIIDSFLQDVAITNAVAASMDVSLSNNFFALAAVLGNAGAAANMQVELDGNTNQIPPTLVNVTQVGYGTVVAPAITAEEAFFDGLGFP